MTAIKVMDAIIDAAYRYALSMAQSTEPHLSRILGLVMLVVGLGRGPELGSYHVHLRAKVSLSEYLD
jgi:hypothetical protein